MPRINFEDRLYRDPRWAKLLLKLGCEYKAKGMLLEAWTIAQANWLKHQGVPKKVWPKALNILIEFEFAEDRDDKIYVKGSKREFAWLEQKSKAGMSKSPKKLESAAKARKSKLNTRSDKTPKNIERTLNETERGLNGSEALTLSHTHSLSQSPTLTQTQASIKTNTSQGGADAPTPDVEKNVRRLCWEAYEKAYREVWKKPPVRNATVNGQIANLVKRLGGDAPEVIDFYVRHKDSFYVKNCHPVGLCLKNAEGLHTQWAKNVQLTGARMRQFEKQQHYQEQLERAESGEL